MTRVVALGTSSDRWGMQEKLQVGAGPDSGFGEPGTVSFQKVFALRIEIAVGSLTEAGG